MKYLALFIALFCGSYTMQAQAYVVEVDSTTKIAKSTIALDLPFIGIIELETPSYAFQQATMTFQIPVLNNKRRSSNFPEVDSLVSARCLPMNADSLDVEG
jgi:hypothetical protein